MNTVNLIYNKDTQKTHSRRLFQYLNIFVKTKTCSDSSLQQLWSFIIISLSAVELCYVLFNQVFQPLKKTNNRIVGALQLLWLSSIYLFWFSKTEKWISVPSWCTSFDRFLWRKQHLWKFQDISGGYFGKYIYHKKCIIKMFFHLTLIFLTYSRSKHIKCL